MRLNIRAGAVVVLGMLACLVLNQACGSSDDNATTTNNGGPCGSSGDCTPPFPYCSGGVCVECLGDANCAGGQACNVNTHSCVECTSDAQCGDQGQPYCSPQGRCVECLASGNCGNNLTCDPLTFRCVPGCTADADCNGALGNPYCSTTRHVCVECVGDGNCQNMDQPYCAVDSGTCVRCLTDANCNGNRCEPNQHRCVECLTNTDCMNGQTCGPDRQCTG